MVLDAVTKGTVNDTIQSSLDLSLSSEKSFLISNARAAILLGNIAFSYRGNDLYVN